MAHGTTRGTPKAESSYLHQLGFVVGALGDVCNP